MIEYEVGLEEKRVINRLHIRSLRAQYLDLVTAQVLGLTKPRPTS